MSASDKSPWPPWGGPPRTAVLTTTGVEQQELLLHWGKSNGRCRSQRALPRLQTGLAQSSMASSWSAKASNMVLMSSRMCLVEVLGGPSRSSVPMLFSAARSAAARDELVCSSLCWARPDPVAPVLSGLGGGTGRGPSRGASLGPENASWVQATDTGLGTVPAPGTLMRAAGGAGGSGSPGRRLPAKFSRAGPGQGDTEGWVGGLGERRAEAP